jgi:hypothetical protein
MNLLEGISHLEDLDLQKFMQVITNLAVLQASEKLDGANLWFGLDESGRLFTSREGKRKNADRWYSERDYPYFAAYNGFRAAHAALESKKTEIATVLQPGAMVEIEVLFGRQPNTVTYGANGKNYIAFLRGVGGTPDSVADQLTSQLQNTSTQVKVQIVDSVDGEKLELKPADITFSFVGSQKIDTTQLKNSDLQKQISALKNFLQQKSKISGRTNFEVMTASLGSFDKDERDAVRQLKKELEAKVMRDFKLPIKKELLDSFVSKIKSPLAASDLSPDEDLGIEGVVLRDPQSGQQVKLVDKDLFTSINQFNNAVRSSINGAVKTIDPDAPQESRGGIIGKMKIAIADALGNVELARTQSAKKIFATLKGKTPTETIQAVARELERTADYRSVRTKVIALIDAALDELRGSLKQFKENKDEFQLKLHNGKNIGLSPEVVRRTLVAFAEGNRDLVELKQKIQKTKTLAQMVAVLYGRIVKELHSQQSQAIEESLLLEKRIYTDKTQYQNKDAWTIFNIYFATFCMAAVIYHADDKPGIRLLRDKTHMRLKAWNKEMSAINFWGYPIWRSSSPAVKKIIGKKVAAELFSVARKVPITNWKLLHIDLSFGREVPVEWLEHRKTLGILQHYAGLNVERINSLLTAACTYNTLTLDEKVKFHTKLFNYIQQFVPLSPIAHRVRIIQNNVLVNASGENYQMVESSLIKEVSALVEEGDVIAPTSATATGASTNSGAIASLPSATIGKMIVRVRRNPDALNKLKFRDPRKLKDKKENSK